MDQLTKISALAAQLVEAIDLEIDRRQLAAATDAAIDILEAKVIDPADSTAPVATKDDAEAAAIRLSKRPGGLDMLQKILTEIFDVERVSKLDPRHFGEFVETCNVEAGVE